MLNSFTRFKQLSVAALIGLTTMLSTTAFAAYPDKPIKMIVPWPPGGGSDTLGRVVAKHMSDRLGQPVIIENKPGATGLIGTDAAVKSKPDGYTLIFIADSYIVSPLVSPQTARYDVNKDFSNIGMVGLFPFVLVVNINNHSGNLQDFINKAKKPDSQITYSSWGIGSSSHLAMEMFKGQTGAVMLHVPFQGASPAMKAVLGGEVDALFVPAAVALPHHQSKKANIIGISGKDRLKAAPELPTLTEQGVTPWISWMGVLGPAGIAQDRVDVLSKAIKSVVNDPKVQAELEQKGLVPTYMGPKELTEFVASENTRIKSLVKEAHVSK
jgi:tripartite-type tricarboxylate transporter receptor subunit TctC